MALDVYKDWLGIPEGPRPPDHYALLRLVSYEDDAEKVRKNYKKLNGHVRKYATGQYSIQSQDLLNEMAKAMLCLTDVTRKKEYDRSLGREFEEEKTSSGRARMENILIKEGHISDSQLQEAHNFAEKAGIELRDALVQLKLVEPAVAAQALANELGIPYVDLADLHPDDEVLDRVPKATVKQQSIMPLFVDDNWLMVACTHLIEPDLEEELRLRIGVPVRPVLADPKAITQAIGKYYAPGARNEVSEPLVGSPSASKEMKGIGGAPAKAADKPAPKKEKPKVVNLTPEERKERNRQRKQIALIMVCWSFVGAWLLDTYVVEPERNLFDLALSSFALYTIIPGAVGLYAWSMINKR